VPLPLHASRDTDPSDRILAAVPNPFRAIMAKDPRPPPAADASASSTGDGAADFSYVEGWTLGSGGPYDLCARLTAGPRTLLLRPAEGTTALEWIPPNIVVCCYCPSLCRVLYSRPTEPRHMGHSQERAKHQVVCNRLSEAGQEHLVVGKGVMREWARTFLRHPGSLWKANSFSGSLLESPPHDSCTCEGT